MGFAVLFVILVLDLFIFHVFHIRIVKSKSFLRNDQNIWIEAHFSELFTSHVLITDAINFKSMLDNANNVVE